MSVKQKLLAVALLIAFLLLLTACQPIQPVPAVTPGAALLEQVSAAAPAIAVPDTASEILWE